ncbi:hypothetical protein ACNJX9_21210 [Bradyrhizobium sp. DASA03076]|uniref:hypothetical protein n=1 Tax=Bradyrhizobium sp. BLXBL-03 TaxID=3395916 RepID=UPI003F7209EE
MIDDVARATGDVSLSDGLIVTDPEPIGGRGFFSIVGTLFLLGKMKKPAADFSVRAD